MQKSSKGQCSEIGAFTQAFNNSLLFKNCVDFFGTKNDKKSSPLLTPFFLSNNTASVLENWNELVDFSKFYGKVEGLYPGNAFPFIWKSYAETLTQNVVNLNSKTTQFRKLCTDPINSLNVCLREECRGLIKCIYNQVNVCFIIDQLSIYPEWYSLTYVIT